MKNKLFALALAGVTVIGAFATGTSVMAEAGSTTGSTTVTLTVPEQEEEPEATYTVTIPSNTTLNTDGSMTNLEGGITVQGNNLDENVLVTPISKNSKKLISENGDTISYLFYDPDIVKNGYVYPCSTWQFDANTLNQGESIKKNIAIKVDNADDIKTAKAGNYSDVITFKTEIERPNDVTNDYNTYWEVHDLYNTDEDKTFGKGTLERAKSVAKRIKNRDDYQFDDIYVIYKYDHTKNVMLAYHISSDVTNGEEVELNYDKYRYISDIQMMYILIEK